MSKSSRLIKSNLTTIEQSKTQHGSTLSPPHKPSKRSYPENKSVSPNTGKARYANLLPVHATGSSHLNNDNRVLNMVEPNFGGASLQHEL